MHNNRRDTCSNSSTGLRLKSRVLCAWYLWLLALVTGCDGNSFSMSSANVAPPHGGTLVFFKDGKRTCCVEVVKKEGTAPITAELSFHFYQGVDVPYEPAPEDGEFWIDSTQKVTLESGGDALVTSTGPVLFADKEVEGVVRVKLNGQEKRIRIGGR